jgi:RNA polymerase sigma-70 factor (ECF subfamily)
MGQDEEDYKVFLGGDQSGFERLILRYKDGLIQFINRYVRDLYQSEDLAQDVFVEVLLHPERYRKGTSFKTYIYTIGHHRAVDYLRKNARLTYVGTYEEAGEGRAAEVLMQEEALLEEKVIKEEEKKILYHAIAKLKAEYGNALYLIDIAGLSYADTARILKKSEGQIKILIYRARKKLKQKLEEENTPAEKI